MTDCAKCGACTAVCPVYGVTGRESLTARGKMHLLERLPRQNYSTAYAKILSECLLCGACEDICPRGLHLLDRIATARHNLPLLVGKHPFLTRLAETTLSTPSLLATVSDLKTVIGQLLPKESGLRIRLGLSHQAFLPQPAHKELQTETSQKPVVAYFSGCLARYPQPEITHATEKLLANSTGSGFDFPTTQVCCGQAAYSSGNHKDAIELAKRNITAFADSTLPILTSCASCYHHLASYPELLRNDQEWVERAHAFAGRLREFSSFFADSPPARKLQPPTTNSLQNVLYHDPCHLRFRHRITKPPRRLLKEAGFSLLELLNGPQCCGMGGLFHLAHPELAEKIGSRMVDTMEPLHPDLVTTTCSGCLLQLRSLLHTRDQTTPVLHLAVLLAGQLKT
ncbi:MAG: (Fe-S)-binding protein [Desulfobulbaceae bacterium]|nr:(Fe-S)-binding protein [Desulfobulbaceae bacterium]